MTEAETIERHGGKAMGEAARAHEERRRERVAAERAAREAELGKPVEEAPLAYGVDAEGPGSGISQASSLNPRAAYTPPPESEPQPTDRPFGEAHVPPTDLTKLKFKTGQQHCAVGWIGGSVKHVRVRAPAGLTADHLKEPALWSVVQENQASSLRKFDHVEVVAFDESWIAEALAVDCRRTGVQLSRVRITSVAQRFDRYLETDTFKIGWNGVGYAVFRKADNHQMCRAESDVHLAERRLIELERGGQA